MPQFAKERQVAIVPVMMQGGGWRPEGWLGLIIAGALWTPLHDGATFQQVRIITRTAHSEALIVYGL